MKIKILIALTVVAFLSNSEIFGLFILCCWGAIAVYKLLAAAAERED